MAPSEVAALQRAPCCRPARSAALASMMGAFWGVDFSPLENWPRHNRKGTALGSPGRIQRSFAELCEVDRKSQELPETPAAAARHHVEINPYSLNIPLQSELTRASIGTCIQSFGPSGFKLQC